MTRTLKLILFTLALGGFAMTAGAWHLGFDLWPPRATLENGSRVPFHATEVQACFKSRLLGLFGDRPAAAHWNDCHYQLAAYRALTAFEARSLAVAAGSLLGLAALFGFAIVLRLEKPPARVLRGPRLLTGSAGRKAFAAACKRECKFHGQGLVFLPPHALGRDRETRHALILGSVGGGKTQSMLHLILGAISRGDGVLVLDTKGDMMAGLPGNPLLVAPHDRRSLVWDVAADCRVKQDARELAARFIPSSADPMWSQAAREIFVACLVHLQATKGTNWSWADLAAEVTSDVARLAEHAKAHNPGALRLLDQPDSKTTHSILTTFQTHMNIVSILAEAWPDSTVARFSIRDWLHDPAPYRPLILQQDPGYPELSRIWIGSMLSLLASAVGSPTLAESSTRRLWLFLDEFPQLPVIRHFPTFLELGRSKGVSVVIGAQDMAQIRSTYGPDQARSWLGMIGTKIITRINAGEAAEDISRMIGNQEIERSLKSTTRAAGRDSVTYSTARETRPAVTAAEIASRLGPARAGVRVLFIGLEDAVFELELPYITLPAFREPIIPADWTRMDPVSGNNGPDSKTPPEPRSLLTSGLAERIRRTRH
ncbi:type IV secretion system DNA-binding domain-containing protein [Hoeflea sp.]|uniref:type IV secretion system DNA-binding domain-containing protein n=1 Tax=Hoeflea sp. TaxID=1940281 RepID=UPI003B02D6E1